MPDLPFVSLVVRTYNRPGPLAELLEAVLQQDYPSFEVVVVDQTTLMSQTEAERITALADDPRVRWQRFPPLGGAGARNQGVRLAAGEILLFLDDDDLPAHPGWIAAHVDNYRDPHCLGVTGRSLTENGGEPSPAYLERARGRVMSLIPVVMWVLPMVYSDRRARVQAVHGTNGSVRRSLFERVGLYDECTSIEDEMSFCYRARRSLRPGEHFVFDPLATIIRRLDLDGGLGKRWSPLPVFGEQVFRFYHNVVAHYFPVRFVALYPVFAAWTLAVCLGWMWSGDHARYRDLRSMAFTTAWFTLAFPGLWAVWLARLLASRLSHGPPRHQPRLEG